MLRTRPFRERHYMTQFAPVLLLGPGRGGTTLLYKLLALHPQIAFISNYDTHPVGRSLAGPLCRLTSSAIALKHAAWFADNGQAYVPKRAFLKKLIPAPVEGEIVYRKCGLTLDEYSGDTNLTTTDRLRSTFAGLQGRHGGAALLLKRTANNRRIPALLTAFPDSKFIVLWRDGRAVTASLLNVEWWLDHQVWWADGQTPRQLGQDRAGMVRLAAQNWIQEVDSIRRGLEHVSSDRMVHVRYEDLLSKPQQTLSCLLGHIGLQSTSEFADAIDTLGLRPPGESWRRTLSLDEQAIAENVCKQHLKSLGY